MNYLYANDFIEIIFKCQLSDKLFGIVKRNCIFKIIPIFMSPFSALFELDLVHSHHFLLLQINKEKLSN